MDQPQRPQGGVEPDFDGGLLNAEPRVVVGTLWAVAEQLKSPLNVIARRAELSQAQPGDNANDLRVIQNQAEAALALIESYSLGLELLRTQAELPFETVSLSSVVTTTAHSLYAFAKQLDVSLEVVIDGKFSPVVANRQGLRAALQSMGYAFVETQAAQSDQRRDRRVFFTVHRAASGEVATGVYGSGSAIRLGAQQWRKNRPLRGVAYQPAPALGTVGAGLLVADTILSAMDTRLRTGYHKRRSGLRVNFRQTPQLTLV